MTIRLKLNRLRDVKVITLSSRFAYKAVPIQFYVVSISRIYDGVEAAFFDDVAEESICFNSRVKQVIRCNLLLIECFMRSDFKGILNLGRYLIEFGAKLTPFKN